MSTPPSKAHLQDVPDFSIAVFPFLKTSRPVQLGRYRFRDTRDVEGLPSEQQRAVREIADMLFLHDDLRIASASYAILPRIEFDRERSDLNDLARLRAVVTYLYSSPRPTWDDVFLGPEEISLAVLTPGPVLTFVLRPDNNTVDVGGGASAEPDDRREVPGYVGLYNLRQTFWVAPGSRLYGPHRHMTLNISQDLAHLDDSYSERPYGRLLLQRLLRRPDAASERIFTALHWYNSANEGAAGPERSLLDLAIAFEALFGLAREAKTESFADTIALLLGRTSRLDQWAKQFYDARSTVAHEGRVRDLYYYANDSKQRQAGDRFGSLMLYGRQVFQLCLSTLLAGADLAAHAGLEDQFVGNNERWTAICTALQADQGSAAERLGSIARYVRGLETFRFVAAAPPAQATVLAAARMASIALLEAEEDLDEALHGALQRVRDTARSEPELDQLAALKALVGAFSAKGLHPPDTLLRIVQDLVAAAWNVACWRYFRLLEAERARAVTDQPGEAGEQACE